MSDVANSMDDRSDLKNRLAFLGLGPSELALVRSRKEMIEGALETGLDRFYEVVASTPQAASFFSSQTQIAGAKQAQIRHWSSICDGALDREYVERVRAIGAVHARIGLEPRWY
ncbi:MAG: protoglobin domain-containing protein, partial [Oricola sp.]